MMISRLILIAGIMSATLAWGETRTIRTAIRVPKGYTRAEYKPGTFSHWLQNLPVKKRKRILSHKGKPVAGQRFNVLAIVDMPLLFKGDLEQCADFCMRLWAECHKSRGKLDLLYLFDYEGEKVYFRDGEKTFVEFLKWAMAYTNSYSLKKGCGKIPDGPLRPGDMIVQNETGGIGHVSMIMDICRRRGKKPLYLIGFSYMPAQEFHIERATGGYGTAGWFTLRGFCQFLSDALPDYGEPVLRRFRDR